MKHRLLILSLLACCAIFCATAQQHYEANIAIGGKLGGTLSRMNFQPSVPQSMQQGFMAGFMFRYMEEKHFGIIAECNIEQRGWKEKFDGFDFNYHRTLTYLQVPMLTHIYFGSNKCRFFINAGPEVGVMLSNTTSANFDVNNYAAIPGFPIENRSNDQLNMKVKHKFDYGISAGMGLEVISRNKSSFLLEGRFYYGLNDIFANHAKDVFSNSSGMSIMVTLGYFYRIK